MLQLVFYTSKSSRVFNKEHNSYLRMSVKRSLVYYIWVLNTLLLSVNVTSVNHFQSGVIWRVVLYFSDAGVINTITKYGRNNLINTVIIVSDSTLFVCMNIIQTLYPQWSTVRLSVLWPDHHHIERSTHVRQLGTRLEVLWI